MSNGSDLIESIHDGSFFGGNATKLGLFLPAGVGLLLLWMTGLWMIWVPFIAKRRRRLQRQRHLAAFALFASGLGASGLAQPRLAVDPIIGHWESIVENGETVVVADARKWQTEVATPPFPLAASEGIPSSTDGVLTVRFKLVAGESDQVAGLAFGLTPRNEYMYVRYNTKDGNVALWQFVDGDRKRILDGTEHLQLPLGEWHELRLEVRGRSVRASVNGKLGLNHQLPAAVPGRVGFWTKRDSTTAFKDFLFTR